MKGEKRRLSLYHLQKQKQKQKTTTNERKRNKLRVKTCTAAYFTIKKIKFTEKERVCVCVQ